jgi:Tfp pilus assembly PilM family ATPase
MSRLLALEWDAKEARIVVGRKRGAALAVDQAFSVPLPQREEGSTAEPDAAGAIAKALAQHGLSRVESLVAVGRSSIELRFLSTPPVPPEELPDLVRFQAVKQFTALGEDWPLDFVPLSPNADGGNNVLAAAISADLVGQIRQTCSAAGVTVSRLVLRPFTAAALLKDQLDDGKCRMIVDLLKDDADLTVLIGSQVIFPRTIRLPAVTEVEALARVLLAEGRRTMIAAQNQLGGRRVEEVVIFGDGHHHSALKQLLEKELSLTVKLVDPFDHIELSDEAKKSKPEFPGTFAPLLGMLLDEAAARPPVIDFLHPRKRPAPPNRRRTYILAGAAVAALVLLGLFAVQMQLWSLDDKANNLKADLAKQQKLATSSKKPVSDANLLDQFAALDVTWIDEISRTSQKFPPPQAARIDDLSVQALPKSGMKLRVTGVANDYSTITKIEASLRDKQHAVYGKERTVNPQLKGLQWQFDEEIIVLPPGGAPATGARPGASKLLSAKQGAGK